jgi:hypothetical protein
MNTVSLSIEQLTLDRKEKDASPQHTSRFLHSINPSDCNEFIYLEIKIQKYNKIK